VVELFNSGNGKILRLSDKQSRHLKIGNWSKKNPDQTVPLPCVLCGKGAHFHCSVCGVVLHKEATYKHPQTTSCWDQWHTNKTNLMTKYSDPPIRKSRRVSKEQTAGAPLLRQKTKNKVHSSKQAKSHVHQPPVPTSPVVTRRQTRSGAKTLIL
jgi:hypothetical protein